MAERYLMVTLSREMYVDVFVKIDDEDPKYANCFTKGGEFIHRSIVLDKVAQEAVENTVSDPDWEVDDGWAMTHGIKEVPKEEASRYNVWDAVKETVLKGGTQNVGPGNDQADQRKGG